MYVCVCVYQTQLCARFQSPKDVSTPCHLTWQTCARMPICLPRCRPLCFSPSLKTRSALPPSLRLPPSSFSFSPLSLFLSLTLSMFHAPDSLSHSLTLVLSLSLTPWISLSFTVHKIKQILRD